MMSSLFDPLSFSSYTPMWLMMLLNLLVKGTVVLLAAALFGLLLQRASASSRYLVWSSALLALVALPILPLLLPVWQIPLPGDLFPVAVSQPVSAVSPALLPTASVNESNTQLPGRLSPQTEAMPAHNSRVKTGDSMVLQEPARRSKPALLSTPTMHWSIIWAVMAWLAGVVAVLGRLAVGFVRAGWLVRRAKPVTDETWKALLLDLADPMGLADRVKLLQSDRAVMPMAWGLFRPVVLLPDDKDQWSDELRRMVLLHELAHVKRRDCLVQMLASTVCSLHWINPMVWIAARRLRIERERACDDYVLSRGVRASDYAEGLLEMARSLRSLSFSSLATVAMAQGSQLESRLLAILNPRLQRDALTRGVMALSIAGVACIALPLAAMQPVAEKSERPVFGVADVQQASPSRLSDGADFQPLQPSAVTRRPAPEPVPIKDQGQVGSLTEWALLSSKLEPQPQPVAPKKSEKRRGDRDRLDQIKNSRDLGVLSEALNDEDVRVRQMAVRALGKIENESAVDLLIRALTDSSGEIRRRSARALGKIEDAGAVEALGAVLNDEDLEVRRAAIRALGDIEDVSGVEWLISALTDSNGEIRREAARALGEIEDANAVEALGAVLNDEDLEVRRAAIRALGEIEDVSAVGGLISALTDSNGEIRREAARALGEIAEKELWLGGSIPAGVPSALGGALNDEDLEVREMAIRALGKTQDVSAVDGLIPLLTDSNAEIRRRAAWALGEIADARAVPALSLVAEDTDLRVRKTATRALREIQRR